MRSIAFRLGKTASRRLPYQGAENTAQKAPIMITAIKVGDITGKENPADIVIGMNPMFGEASAIGHPFVSKIIPLDLAALGSVLTFDFEGTRQLHMIICHKLGPGGWKNSEKFVRFGLDYLWQTSSPQRLFSIVQIGLGPVGIIDGADYPLINRAMSDSHLEMTLYVRSEQEEPEQSPRVTRAEAPLLLRFRQGWSFDKGVIPERN